MKKLENHDIITQLQTNSIEELAQIHNVSVGAMNEEVKRRFQIRNRYTGKTQEDLINARGAWMNSSERKQIQKHKNESK